MWPIYGALGPLATYGGRFAQLAHSGQVWWDLTHTLASRKLEAVRLMAMTEPKTGKSVDSGRKVV